MSESDAGRLQRWVASLPAALAAVADAKPGNRLGPDGLAAVWAWAGPQLAWSRSPGTDPLETAPNYVPEWAAQPGHRRERITLSLPTLHLIGHIGRYLGECVRLQIPAADWVIWHWKAKGAAASGEGDPALTVLDPATELGGRGAVFPLRDVTVSVQRLLDESPEPDDLVRVLDMRVGELAEAARKLKN
jgi:hypothetical protein